VRYAKEHKAETRSKIVRAAARLFREHGYDGVGVDAIMNEVGLTAGGFYAHFGSKEALFAEAIGAGLGAGRTTAESSSQNATSTDAAGGEALVSLIRGYLSRTHRDHVADGCPLPVLTPDVARSHDAVRQEYEDQFLKYVAGIESLLEQDTGPSRSRALAIIAQCVGGLMLARGVKDEDLSNQILKASREAAMKI